MKTHNISNIYFILIGLVTIGLLLIFIGCQSEIKPKIEPAIPKKPEPIPEKLKDQGKEKVLEFILPFSIKDKVGKGTGFRSRLFKMIIDEPCILDILLDIKEKDQDLDLLLCNEAEVIIGTSSEEGQEEKISTEVEEGIYYIRVKVCEDYYVSRFLLSAKGSPRPQISQVTPITPLPEKTQGEIQIPEILPGVIKEQPEPEKKQIDEIKEPIQKPQPLQEKEKPSGPGSSKEQAIKMPSNSWNKKIKQGINFWKKEIEDSLDEKYGLTSRWYQFNIDANGCLEIRLEVKDYNESLSILLTNHQDSILREIKTQTSITFSIRVQKGIYFLNIFAGEIVEEMIYTLSLTLREDPKSGFIKVGSKDCERPLPIQ